ncbi:MAG: 2-succinyl-5-enolpyruvyl-6-hydroxy-3-cyclohexene-1-carboxylic-acid synthase [Tannerellaceae bacterium]|jgi:2-succinyl-5-enolpyruvyl-6-hydroxy-3-cyclohexene-1-carboxylate synthase|nr:2-succinyl-5-enolpyruvyl-6-hydroxy-3-cyclohexene-1-carboxylic-acid synthase [Tannerellaceae bacterium]
MYPNKKNILQLVALMKQHEVNRVIISSGARNLPIVQALVRSEYFICSTIVDERSAGFVALGMSLKENKCSVALCCTSGSAALNYAPAIAEAWHRNICLLVITADRPEAWLGQGENQTIRQQNIFGSFVKMSVTLPEVHTDEDEWYCNRLINEAILETSHIKPGPVHINVPISEPLLEFPVETLPEVRVIQRIPSWPGVDDTDGELEYLPRRYGYFDRPMLILGQGNYGAGPLMILDSVLANLHSGGCVILGEHLACNCDTKHVIRNFDTILEVLPEEGWANYAPDLLITVGGQLVSKTIKKFLRKHKPEMHWHVSPWGELVDTYQSLTHAIQTSPGGFLWDLQAMSKAQPPREAMPYLSGWYRISKHIPPPAQDYSDLMAVGELMKAIAKPAVLHLANSSSVRLAHLFPLADGVQVYANRGTSGIEGCLSTALGETYRYFTSSTTTYFVTGDLAFFTDMNALWGFLNNHHCNLRILLNNNRGGGIFHCLPGFNQTDANEIAIAYHNISAKEWAIECGLIYLEVHNHDDLMNYMPAFTDKDIESCMLMEVFSARIENSIELENYYDAISL